MSSTGRKKDVIWSYFDVVKDNNKKSVTAKCKKCKVIMAGLVQHMKKHIQKCVPSENSQQPMSTIYDSDPDEDLTLAEKFVNACMQNVLNFPIFLMFLIPIINE
ncbi:unnamed protein product [Phaedon cochleariae]|uniref:BED-type domain-containing protein n=1 Tax=Phaedon cochleariae TaxID=80249 RepID=A0A9P0GSA8_PHACE|nr:unnamed protein product [Phaedon cochleariae]